MRLFIAVEFSEEIRHELIRLQDRLARNYEHALKFTPAHQLHLTLRFLGDQPETGLVAIRDTLACALIDTKIISLELENCGVFPERDPVRIIWAGLKESSGKLLEEVAKIDSALFLLGIDKEDRAFVPHVTLARVKDRLPEDFRAEISRIKIRKVVQRVCSISLVESVLKQAGPEYTTVQRFELSP